MPKDDRKQINIRVSDELLERIEALRGARRPIPNVTDLFHDLINEAYEREVAKGRRRN